MKKKKAVKTFSVGLRDDIYYAASEYCRTRGFVMRTWFTILVNNALKSANAPSIQDQMLPAKTKENQ